MPVLYITEQGANLRKTGHRLVVEKNGQELTEVECFRVEAILIYGNVQVTTQALTEILRNGIELAFLSEDGSLKGQLTPPLPKNILIRVKQYETCNNQDFVLKQAKFIVQTKISNGLELLKQADWDRAEDIRKSARHELHDLLLRSNQCSSLQSLVGVEGAAAQAYFTAFPSLLKDPGLFQGRSRRPPRDPVNAVLSFGYVLLVSQLQSLLDAVGFDPYMGYLHSVSYGRPSLALDLVEPYRAPVVDRLAVRLFNLKILQPHDFEENEERGFRLRPEGLKRFFAEWEQFLGRNEVRRAMQKQVDTLSQVLKGERDFPEHFIFKAD